MTQSLILTITWPDDNGYRQCSSRLTFSAFMTIDGLQVWCNRVNIYQSLCGGNSVHVPTDNGLQGWWNRVNIYHQR